MNSTDQTETCAARRPYLGPTDPIRVAAMVLIVCTKEAGHQSPHYDASCDVSWPHVSADDESVSAGLGAKLAGHSLRLYGNPFESDGMPSSIYAHIGRARCECGEMSPEYASNAMRRQWHRDHKQAVRDAT